MAVPDERNIPGPSPGSLCIDPTDLTAAFPHGGTALGVVRDEEFRPGMIERVNRSEFMGSAVEVYQTGQDPIFVCVLRQWDDDALSAAWPDVDTSGTNPMIRGRVSTNAARAGLKLSSKAVALCFSPRALDTDRFIVLYKAIPVIQEGASIVVNLGAEVGIGMMWRGIPDATGRLYDIGTRTDITL